MVLERDRVEIAPITEKIVESRLKRYKHVRRRPIDTIIGRVDHKEGSSIARALWHRLFHITDHSLVRKGLVVIVVLVFYL